MEIVFYESPMSSAVPVACALSELEVPHRKVTLDLVAGDQRRPDFLKLNPNGKVPTLVVDGTPMFEALAIMQWLGERFGVARGVWPKVDDPARLTALSWSTWVYVTYGAATSRLFLSSSPQGPAALRSPAAADHARKELQELLGVLENPLRDRPFLLGQQFGLTDLIVANVVMWGRLNGVATTDHPRVHAWADACAERPSIKTHWS